MFIRQSDDPIDNHSIQQTDPRDYVLNVAEAIRQVKDQSLTQSQRIIRAFGIVRAEVKTHGFRRKVQEAIFRDAVASDYSDPKYVERLIARAESHFGKIKAKKLFTERSEILQSWHHRDVKFVPDAYLIDPDKRTVVCYEVEDHHPLNSFTIGKYADAWWTLEYIYWDLHLIAYDVFGNARIIAFPHSEFIASELRKTRNSPSS